YLSGRVIRDLVRWSDRLRKRVVYRGPYDLIDIFGMNPSKGGPVEQRKLEVATPQHRTIYDDELPRYLKFCDRHHRTDPRTNLGHCGVLSRCKIEAGDAVRVYAPLYCAVDQWLHAVGRIRGRALHGQRLNFRPRVAKLCAPESLAIRDGPQPVLAGRGNGAKEAFRLG